MDAIMKSDDVNNPSATGGMRVHTVEIRNDRDRFEDLSPAAGAATQRVGHTESALETRCIESWHAVADIQQ
jgi:hypothetical protein